MICKQCRSRHHEDCPGGSWCDCQHAGTGVPVLSKDDRHRASVDFSLDGPRITVTSSTPGTGDRP